jgi:UDP-glucuronate 4-epimerase
MGQEHFLVTGALGCLGAWVVRNLVQAGIETTVFDLGTDLQRLRLIMSDDELAKVQFANGGDISNLELLKSTMKDKEISHIIHLAALQVPTCRANPALGAQVNVVGTVNVFEAARYAGLKQVIYASSIAVYGPRGNYPEGLLSHDAPFDPRSHYGVYKMANEASARVFHVEAGISSIGLRPYTIYGPGRDQGMTSAPTSAMKAAAQGEGFHIPFGGVSGYQHADDVAKLFIQAAKTAFDGAAVFNLKGEIASMNEVVSYIEAAAPEVKGKISFDNNPLPFPDGADDSELRKVLGTIPNRPLKEGIAATIAHFKAQRESSSQS